MLTEFIYKQERKKVDEIQILCSSSMGADKYVSLSFPVLCRGVDVYPSLPL